MKITFSGVGDISIDPNSQISNGSSGCITVISDTIKNEIIFKLEYSDERMNRQSIKYLLTISDKKLKEIY